MKMLSDNEPDELDDEMRAQLRSVCADVIDRLPSISEFGEWHKRLDAATTDDELLKVADSLQWLLGAYRQYQGVDIRLRKPFSWR